VLHNVAYSCQRIPARGFLPEEAGGKLCLVGGREPGLA
jgi:hypothetical protein